MNFESRTPPLPQPMPESVGSDRASAQLLQNVAQLAAENERLKIAISDSTALREQLESILRQRDQEAQSLGSRLIDVQRQRDEAIGQLRQTEARIAGLEARLAETFGSRGSDDRRAEELASEIEALKAAAESEKRAAEERRHALEAELAKLKTTLITVQNEYARLRDDVAPAMAKATRHDRLMQVLPAWIEALLLRIAGGRAR